MKHARAALAGALVLALAGAVASASSAPAYLPGGGAPDAVRYLPPPPAKGSKAEAADIDAFKRTRRLEGTARWRLAQSDAKVSPTLLLQDFGCALGTMPEETREPALFSLWRKLARAIGPVIAGPKDHYGRKRPYLLAKGRICVEDTPGMDASGSYPSGHTTLGWSTALVLAELAPDRATEILARGRAYGESRVVCGVHYPTDVAAGRTDASGVVAVLHADAAFRADMDKARAELAAARAAGASPPDPARCKVEDEAAAKTPW